MRSYFRIRERGRGNVYAESQPLLSENTVINRNDSVDAEPPAGECSSWYPLKASILKEFSPGGDFEAQKEALLASFANAGIPIDPSLTEALYQAEDWLSRGYTVAITAATSMLNKTLIHYNEQPIIGEPSCGHYDYESPKLLLSNGRAIHSTDCGGSVFFHPFAWQYIVRTKMVEPLTASPGICFIGASVGLWTGNAAWDVRPTLPGYRFVDFAQFSRYVTGDCKGFPSIYSGPQLRCLAGSPYGVPVYLDVMDKIPVVIRRVAQYPCASECSCGSCGCYCSGCGSGCIVPPEPTYVTCVTDAAEVYPFPLYFVVPTYAYPTAQQAHAPYASLPICGGLYSSHAYLYRAYTSIGYWPEGLGVPTPYYREYLREMLGTETEQLIAPYSLHWWILNNTTASCGNQETRKTIFEAMGRPAGIYSTPDEKWEGKRIGAQFVMAAEERSDPVSCCPFNGWRCSYCADTGDWVEGVTCKIFGFRSPPGNTGSAPSIVTFQSTDMVEAAVYLEEAYLTGWNAAATFKAKLHCRDDWEMFDSSELWTVLQEAGRELLTIYVTGSAEALSYDITEQGVSGNMAVEGGIGYLTLIDLCRVCGIEPSEGNVHECYELLRAGLTVVFRANARDTGTVPMATVKSIALSDEFSDEPCVNWFCS